jgi:hypothetical protein
MNSSNLLKLTIAAAVLILGAWWLTTRNSATSDVAEAALYPELKGKLAEVQRLRVFGKGDQLAVEIVREGDAFLVEQRHRHPADNSKVKTLLVNLESAKLREEKTANPANYNALGVEALSEDSATGTRVELTGAAVNLVIGKKATDAKANYVRRAEDKTSWLIDVELDAPTDPSQWLQRNVLDIAANRIAEATVEVGGGKPYTASKAKQADAHFDVTPIPKGRELSSVSAAAPLAQSLTGLQLEDVRPIAELANDKPAHRATLRTFDGVTIHIAGYGSGDDNWITLSASFDEALAKRFHPSDAQAAKEKAEADVSAAFQKARGEAEAINKQSANWAYSIPAYKFEQLFKPLEQMLKSK